MSGKLLAGFASIVMIATPAVAQDFAMGWFNDSAQIMDSYVGQAAMASVAIRRPAPKGRETSPERRSPPPRRAVASLTFAVDANVSRQVRDRFRDQLVRSNPAKAGEIDTALKQDWMRGYASDIARPNGFDPRNVADSHAAYLIASWALVNNVTTLPPRGITAVRDKVRADLIADPKIAALSVSRKQELGENLNYNTVLVMANRTRIYETGDKALRAAATRHYSAQFARLGIDLTRLQLTDAGFVAR